MVVGYVKQADYPIKILDKFQYYFNVIKVKKSKQGYILCLPISDKFLFKFYNDNLDKVNKKEQKKINKVMCKMIKILKKYDIDTLAFSKKLSTGKYSFQDEFKEMMNIQILTGKKLMMYMLYNILEYILKIQKKQISQIDVFFLIKKDMKLDLQFLTKFLDRCKTVNIVTNDLDRFRKIQENLYEKENILISVSNNKNKALKRAKYIFNINMDKKDIEKYKIGGDALIINIKEFVKYNKKGFNGININLMKIFVPDEYLEKFEDEIYEFDSLKLYESIILAKIQQKQAKSIVKCENNVDNMYFDIADEIIKLDEIQIKSLLGNNGEICVEEFINIIRKCENII